MMKDPHPCFVAEIKSRTIMFKQINNTQALFIMAETVGMNSIQGTFSGMPERCMSEIMSEGYSLGKILIQTKRSCNSSREPADFKCVGKAGSIMITLGLQKNLCFMLQAAKCLAMRNSIHITLKTGTDITLSFGKKTPLV